MSKPWKFCDKHPYTVKYRDERCPYCKGGVDEDMADALAQHFAARPERFTEGKNDD